MSVSVVVLERVATVSERVLVAVVLVTVKLCARQHQPQPPALLLPSGCSLTQGQHLAFVWP